MIAATRRTLYRRADDGVPFYAPRFDTKQQADEYLEASSVHHSSAFYVGAIDAHPQAEQLATAHAAAQVTRFSRGAA